MNRFFACLYLAVLVSACAECEVIPGVKTAFYGVTQGGDTVTQYILTNASGAQFKVIDYGCRVTNIMVPDREGKMADVVLGYENLKDYETGAERFFGALLGRYANRIAGGDFMIDSVRYQLSCNESPNGHPGHLHGGVKGFDRVIWKAMPVNCSDTLGIVFTRCSPDGEEGYPGNLDCKVTYYWTQDNTWRIEYEAVTDQPTIVNMSQHCYFNLQGYDGGSVLNHIIQINADSVMVNTPWYVPVSVESVVGGPLDFRTPHSFAERVTSPNEHMKLMGGYSANWILRDYNGDLRYAATVTEPQSGRQLETYTTEPGLLIYTGIGLSEKIVAKGGPQQKYGGLILETIHHPDTPHHPEFPSCVLRPHEKYYSVTEYRFTVQK